MNHVEKDICSILMAMSFFITTHS